MPSRRNLALFSIAMSAKNGRDFNRVGFGPGSPSNPSLKEHAMRAVVFLALVVLAGCHHSLHLHQIHLPHLPPMDAKVSAADDEACQSSGARPGTAAYFDCRMARDRHRQH
jgi:hypothetical protein